MEFFEDLLSQAPDGLIRDLVLQLFPSEGGTGFAGLMLTLNTAVASIGTLMLLFQVFIHIIAHGVSKAQDDGEGDKASLINDQTVVGYIRSIVALLFIIPNSASGLNLFNQLVITLMLAGSNLAQVGWDTAFETMYAEPIDSDVQALSVQRDIGLQLFEANVCFYYLQLETGANINRIIDNDGGEYAFPGRSSLFSSKPHCGLFETQDTTDVVPALSFTTGSSFNLPDLSPVNLENLPYRGTVIEYGNISTNVFRNLQEAIAPLARQFALSAYPRTAAENQPPSTQSLEQVFLGYERQMSAAHARLKRDVFDIVNNNRQRSEASKWYNAGGYMRRLSEANFLTNKAFSLGIPTSQPTQWNRIWANPPDHVTALTNKLREFLNEGQPAFVQYVQQNEWQDSANTDTSQLMSLLLRYLNDSIIQFDIDHTQDEHPLTVIVDDGNFFTTVGASIAAVQTVLAGVPILGNVQGGLEEWLTPIMWMFLIAGFFMSALLPLLPWLFSMIAIFAWVVISITTFVGGSLWLVFHIRIRSSQIAFGTGWVALLEVLLRPLVILIALWISYNFFIICSQFLAASFSNALNNMQFTSIQVIIYNGLYSILYSILQIVAAVACFLLIPSLTGEAFSRVPHDGDIFGGSK